MTKRPLQRPTPLVSLCSCAPSLRRWGGLFLLGAMLAGCQTGSYPAPRAGRFEAPRTVRLQDLARQLGLHVDEINDTYAKLTNTDNTVLVFRYGGGQFHVNGRPAGPAGRIDEQGGTLYVEASLAGRIRPLLQRGRPGPTPPSTRPPRVESRGLIVVDPGHGGKDPGTRSVLGFAEKEINLSVGRLLARDLRRRGFEVVMTRDADRFIELEERAALANRRGAALFISVHADYCDTPSITGFTIYTARAASRRSQQVAASVKQALLRTGHGTRGIREADYRVLVKTRCPAILVELGYLSNTWESRRLRDIGMQQRLAQAIAAGADRLWVASENSGSMAPRAGRGRSYGFSAP